MLLRLRRCLALLWLRIHLALLWLRIRLTLLLLRIHLALLLLRGKLPLFRIRLAHLRLRIRLTLLLLLLRIPLALLLLRIPLTPLLLRIGLTLLLLRIPLTLLLLLYIPIGCLERCWSSHVAIGRKRLVDSHIRWAAMIRVGKLGPVSAGSMLILHLCPHGRSVLLMHRRQFLRPRPFLDTTPPAVETHTGVVAVAAHRAAVDVVHHRDVDVVDRAVVIKVASAPVAALVAESHVAKAIVDAAIVADVLAPVAGVKPVGVIPVAPVAGGPERALVGSLNPCAGHPVVAVLRGPGPVAGCPEIVVAGSRRLVVVGQRRRRLRSGVFRLLSVTWIVRPLVRRRSTLLVAWIAVGLVLRTAGIVRNGRQIGRRRVRPRILRAHLVIGRGQGLILMATGS